MRRDRSLSVSPLTGNIGGELFALGPKKYLINQPALPWHAPQQKLSSTACRSGGPQSKGGLHLLQPLGLAAALPSLGRGSSCKIGLPSPQDPFLSQPTAALG